MTRCSWNRINPRVAAGMAMTTKPGGGESHPALPPITLPERVAAIILMALLVIVGVYPSIMLNMIKANVQLFLRGAP